MFYLGKHHPSPGTLSITRYGWSAEQQSGEHRETDAVSNRKDPEFSAYLFRWCFETSGNPFRLLRCAMEAFLLTPTGTRIILVVLKEPSCWEAACLPCLGTPVSRRKSFYCEAELLRLI